MQKSKTHRCLVALAQSRAKSDGIYAYIVLGLSDLYLFLLFDGLLPLFGLNVRYLARLIYALVEVVARVQALEQVVDF